MNSIWRTLAWLLMVLLSLGIAAYAAGLLVYPPMRSSFVLTLLAERPVATLGHFGGSALALAIGGFQLHPGLRRRFGAVHRWMGRLYLVGVALGGAAGLWMALFANGGLAGRLGFALLALSWLTCTARGYASIRARELQAHRRWMIRSYALTFAAVTLRLYIPAGQVAGIAFESAYPVIAWLCWVPNLLVAEWLARGGAATSAASRLEGGLLKASIAGSKAEKTLTLPFACGE
jgi:hypothetical protein